MLTCYMCGETKPEAEFAFADMARGTRQRHCRRCQAAYRREHYLANREAYIRREVARINMYRSENRALMVAYLLGHPCVDCGEADPIKLEFDHREPAEKKGNISELAMRQPWRLVLVEIAKCDVRCANCHLRRTAQQFNWRKLFGRPLAEGTWLAPELQRRRRGGQRDTYWSWLMTYLAARPCVDCGETDSVVLQFDHRDGTTKVATIGALLSKASWHDLLREIAKCDVRCANCHRLRTAEQFGWSKWIRETA